MRDLHRIGFAVIVGSIVGLSACSGASDTFPFRGGPDADPLSDDASFPLINTAPDAGDTDVQTTSDDGRTPPGNEPTGDDAAARPEAGSSPPLSPEDAATEGAYAADAAIVNDSTAPVGPVSRRDAGVLLRADSGAMDSATANADDAGRETGEAKDGSTNEHGGSDSAVASAVDSASPSVDSVSPSVDSASSSVDSASGATDSTSRSIDSGATGDATASPPGTSVDTDAAGIDVVDTPADAEAGSAVVDPCAMNNGGCGSSAVFACANNPGQAPTCSERPVVTVTGNSVTGIVSGLAQGKTATVILGNDGYLASQVVASGQSYRFDNLPAGTYYLKLDVAGHVSGKAKTISVGGAPMAPPVVPGTVQPMAVVPGADQATDPADASTEIDFATTPLATDVFTFHWEEDPSRAGQNQTAYVNQPPVVQFLDQTVPVPDAVSADQLSHDYNIILSNESEPWNEEYAYRLLETLKTIPQVLRDPYAAQALKPSRWILSGDNLENDVQINPGANGTTVTIADAAFNYATPRMVTVNGVRGTFFSKRLHHALVQYITNGGTDLNAVESILNQRYGCSTVVPDYAALTAPTTAETAAAFQAFHPDELVLLINMFEEMPERMHSVPGLKYLLRRRDGTTHPWYPTAPAVAWAIPASFPNGSYIEFMESGFTEDPDDVHRLILHEKAHFLWGYVFSTQLEDDWTTLGGWYVDPTAPAGWSTTKDVEYVSAYAHQKNPNEDMAESVAYFVLDPDALMSRAPEKYAFIRDRVMQGDFYISMIPQALTFQVLDLYPNYTYPGKIQRVDIRVDGAPDEDKVATIEIALNTLANVFAGASSANLRLFSPIGTYMDVWLEPTDSQGAVLRGSAPISKYAKSGLWRTDQIVINDADGNQRFEGVNDFGWRLYVDNPLEDVVAPNYVAHSLGLSVLADTVTEADGVHPVYRAHITWQVDDRTMGTGQSVHAYLTNPLAYSHQAWGMVDANTSQASVDIILTDFDANGAYGVPSILMIDAAGNRTTVTFSSAAGNEPESYVTVDTKTPDSHPPEVSLNDNASEGLHAILVSATPTHPAAPDGETAVTVKYQARDDMSGLGQVSYRLLDPQGLSHFQYDYHDNFYTTFFQGDPTAWTEYTISVLLPVGSAPGTWGLQELVAWDKAGNQLDLNFVETMHFEVQ
jgi:hypothetical protein